MSDVQNDDVPRCLRNKRNIKIFLLPLCLLVYIFLVFRVCDISYIERGTRLVYFYLFFQVLCCLRDLVYKNYLCLYLERYLLLSVAYKYFIVKFRILFLKMALDEWKIGTRPFSRLYWCSVISSGQINREINFVAKPIICRFLISFEKPNLKCYADCRIQFFIFNLFLFRIWFGCFIRHPNAFYDTPYDLKLKHRKIDPP